MAAGQKIEDSLLKIFYRPGSDPISKLGIALSSSVFKRAVDRNRARRLTSKAFEDLYDRIADKQNIIAMPKAGILKKKSDAVARVLEELLQNANLLK